MSKIIAVVNQKGGVGKTTTTVNLCASLNIVRRKVLLIDLDPQGNATMGSGIDKNTLTCSMNDVLMEQAEITDIITPAPAGYDIAPSNGDLTEAEVNLVMREQRETVLKRALIDVPPVYDFIFIDCPPALNMLTMNALVATQSVLIPMQCEYYALEGLAALMGTVSQVQAQVNPHLHIEGVLRTMFDTRNRLCTEVAQQLLAHFKEKVYRTVIPRNVRLAEAPSHGLPAIMHDKHSPGAKAYLVLAGEFIGKQRKKPTAVRPSENLFKISE